MTGSLRLFLRALLTWAIEAAALYLMLRYLPGVAVADWRAAGARAVIARLAAAERVDQADLAIPFAPSRTA